MPIVPDWFVRELKVLDDSYFVEYDSKYGYYVIKKKLNKLERGYINEVEIWLATFPRLNDRAMANLRYRKWMGRKFEGDMKKYIRYLKGLNKEAKQKAKELGYEMMAEGLMKIHNFGRKSYFT